MLLDHRIDEGIGHNTENFRCSRAEKSTEISGSEWKTWNYCPFCGDEVSNWRPQK